MKQPNNEIIAAIDIGTTKIVAIIGGNAKMNPENWKSWLSARPNQRE